MKWARFSSSRSAAALAVGLAAAVLGLQAGPLVWTLAGHPADGARAAMTGPAPGTRGALSADRDQDPGAGLAVFAAADPFGIYTPPAAADPLLAETGLGLTLHGVVVGTPVLNSRAFIMNNGAVAAYRPGDRIISGVRLDEVRARLVILDVEGVRETLSLPELDMARPSPVRSGAGVSNMLSQLSPSARATAASNTGPAAGGVTGGMPGGGPQAVIETYRRRIEANPQAVLDSLGLEASEAGYRIGAAPPDAVRRAGLQPGDVVTRVNGRAVGDVQSDRRLYDLVAAEGRARIEVRRGDRTITLTFPLQ